MPTAPDQLIDQSVRHAVYLERYKSAATEDYAELLTKMEKAIRAELSMPITDYSRARLEAQLTTVRGALENIGTDIEAAARGQVIDLARYEVEFEARSLGNVATGYDFAQPADAQLMSAVYSTPIQAQWPYQGQLLGAFIEGWSGRNVQRLDGAIRLGYARGQTTQQIVRDIFGMGGQFAQSRRDLETMVRTGLAHTAQVARQEVWSENSDIVKGYRISATLDSRTSSTCRSLDGKVFPMKNGRPDGPVPPFHINCRTTTTAALDSRFDFTKKGATRAARDPETGKVKRVAADTTYYGWLKRQPAAVQDSIIGKTRGKLLRNGGLTADRFAELNVGKDFKPLTLEQMRKLEPIAFQKANV